MMINKDAVNGFNAIMAEKLGLSLYKSMIEKNVIDKGISPNAFKDFIFRMLYYYSSINFNDLYYGGKTDKVREKEVQIELETYVTQPEIWEQWKRNWDYQKPLHDKDWLKSVLKEEAQEYNEQEP